MILLPLHLGVVQLSEGVVASAYPDRSLFSLPISNTDCNHRAVTRPLFIHIQVYPISSRGGGICGLEAGVSK